MRKHLFKTALLLLPLLLSACTSPPEQIATLPDAVSVEHITRFHQALYTANGNSRGFTHKGSVREPAYQHDSARDYLLSTFREMGYSASLDPFHFTRFNAVYTNCANVVAIKTGSPGSRIHIIGAHYDTVDAAHEPVTRCPGADDNGSGVAALLETARVIQHAQFRDTIIFVAFDAEEKGAYGPGQKGSPGAQHFLKTYTADDPSTAADNSFLRSAIAGMISVDMIGYDNAETPPYVVIGRKNFRRSSTGKHLENAIETSTGLIPRQAFGYNQSDHMPFHHAGIDAVHLVEYDFRQYWPGDEGTFIENPYYHTDADSIDSPDYIAYPYIAEITKALTAYLCEQAVLIP
ncbi:M28 family metallopeptidase [Pontiella agarivorans]|uniref:M28 family metallopeptidase n=1 Tax=Pontiella agarivorans TaxID=3038953 RepID=A0ABU5MVY2_9BACT|nr:M28 family metallopeptidase [Pontiella agarivorans]MDZ8118373.1 M28 family metallopeptidase [Pontiella agarivorans]